MKLILIGLAILAFPLVSMWLEDRDPGRSEIRQMADRDRKQQATRLPDRRRRYAACPCQAGRGGRLPFENKKHRPAVARRTVICREEQSEASL